MSVCIWAYPAASKGERGLIYNFMLNKDNHCCLFILSVHYTVSYTLLRGFFVVVVVFVVVLFCLLVVVVLGGGAGS